VNTLGELLDRPQARLVARLGERLREQDPTLLAQPPAETLDQLARVETVIPDIEMALVREVAHPLAVRPSALGQKPLPAIRRQPDVAAGDLGAGRHSLDIPLPRTGQRLVEVIRAEHEPAVLSREPAEVRDVGITARLHDDPRIRRRREIGRHHGRRPAVERERRDEHPPVPDRDELLQARRRLGLEYRNGIGPVRRRRPVAVSRPRCGPSGRSTTLGGLPGLQPCVRRRSHANTNATSAECRIGRAALLIRSSGSTKEVGPVCLPAHHPNHVNRDERHQP
jgi:hypothetical protein